jgi:hypothetical protein
MKLLNTTMYIQNDLSEKWTVKQCCHKEQMSAWLLIEQIVDRRILMNKCTRLLSTTLFLSEAIEFLRDEKEQEQEVQDV